MESFESVYVVFVILIMLLASLSAASFLVWRYRRQGPFLIQVAPEAKAPPYVTASDFGVQIFHDPKIPKHCVLSQKQLSKYGNMELQLSNMPKLSEHMQLLRPKAPPRIPSTCPELQCPKVNRYDVRAKRVASQKLTLHVESLGSCWYKQSEKAGPSPKRQQRDEASSESRPRLQPKCPRDTMEAPPWPQAGSNGEVKLFAGPVGSQPTDPSPKELIRKNPNTKYNWLFAEIVLDGRGEPQDYVPQRLTAHRVPKRVIFLPDSIGRFPRHLEHVPSLPKPSFEPPWPAKLQPKLWETGSHRAKLMTPPTPKQTPATAPTRREPRRPPALPRLWPREGPWWTFGSSYKN